MSSSLYHYFFSSSSSSTTKATTTKNSGGRVDNNDEDSTSNDERTSLLSSQSSSTTKPQQLQQQQLQPATRSSSFPSTVTHSNKNSVLPAQQQQQAPSCYSTDSAPTNPSAHEFFFPRSNPSIQRYYRFTSTTLTPIAALHKKPALSGGAGNYTGLLRRSAVVPSHGTDAIPPHHEWVLVSVGGRSGWARKAASDIATTATTTASAAANAPPPHAGFTPADTFRASEAWMGNHVFLFHGKCMLGSDAPSLFFTNALLLVGLSVYFFYLIPKVHALALLNAAAQQQQQPYNNTTYHGKCFHGAGDDHDDGGGKGGCYWSSLFWLLEDHPVALLWTSIALTLLTFVTLWMTALTDPGILPALSSPLKPPPPPHELLGGPVGYRYCSTCNIFRPPRSKHCNSCNCCVAKFDHHCPWTGNCIGERNHAIFFAFLLSISSLLMLVTAVTIRLLFAAYEFLSLESDAAATATATTNPFIHGTGVEDGTGVDSVVVLPFPGQQSAGTTTTTSGMKDILEYSERTSHRVWDAILSMPVVCLFGTFTLLCAWSLLSLLFYHAVIISMAQTTNERVRGVYRTGIATSTNNANSNMMNNNTVTNDGSNTTTTPRSATNNNNNSNTRNTASSSTTSATSPSSQQLFNAADQGCCRNWYNAFCHTIPASRLPPDFSEWVITEEPVERPWSGPQAVAAAAAATAADSTIPPTTTPISSFAASTYNSTSTHHHHHRHPNNKNNNNNKSSEVEQYLERNNNNNTGLPVLGTIDNPV